MVYSVSGIGFITDQGERKKGLQRREFESEKARVLISHCKGDIKRIKKKANKGDVIVYKQKQY